MGNFKKGKLNIKFAGLDRNAYENLIETMKRFVQKVKNACERFVGAMIRISKAIIRSQILIFKRKPRKNKSSYKLNLNRPIIRHQVIDRKPRHINKRIIH